MNIKLISLCLLAILALTFGAAGQFWYPESDNPPTDGVLVILGLFLLFLWYRADALQRSFKRPIALNILVVAIAAIGMPYYFFRSRGFKGGLFATFMFFLAILALGLLSGLGSYAAYALQA